MSRRVLVVLTVIAIAAVALIVGISGLAAGGAQSLEDAGDQFMQAIQNHDMTAAFQMLSPEFQAKVGEGNFKEIFAEAAVAQWSFSSRSVQNGEGILSGNAKIDEKAFKIELNFIQQDGKWQLTAYNFNQ